LKAAKRTLVLLAIAVIAGPSAVIVTVLLSPLWRWVESTTGLESIGHSGPASWCFVVIYILSLLTGYFFLRRLLR